eukprot:113544-Prorocentrum_minimum.AAC.2
MSDGSLHISVSADATPQQVWDGVLQIAANDKIADHCPGCSSVNNNKLLQVGFPPACTPTEGVPDTPW